ncbi:MULTISPECIES: multidrug effflux MFS transporter [unclassified Legionella]|uniref:multidrug effflux MFS transporter n=1 Tax=unclassified Legionella TaxID=2622702 RepID=UPI001055F27A|nr:MULTISPECIES: multidrug effflux MFS transporter [unclassified Legionella]MDI9819506.1 multidrug effflux MFS transporter [Legionella sp. PL877]
MQNKVIPQPKTTPFLFLGILSTFSLLTFDLYQPALPAMTNYFNTSHVLGQLTLSLFFFVFGFSQLIWGPLVDHFGRKKTLRLSLFLFLAATLACIFSINITMLIIARMFQGFTVCCAYIVAFSSTRDQEDSTDRARVLSHISMIVSVSPIFAPLVGSVIFTHYGWQATFVLMGLIAVFLLVSAEKVLLESPHWSKTDTAFLWQTSWATYKKILTHQRLWIGTALVTASYSCVMIVVINAAFLVIDNLGITPFYFAILFGSNGLMLILGNFIGIKLREHKSLTWNICAGSLLMTLSSLLMLLLFYIYGLSLISLAPTLLINLGVSLVNPPAFSLVLSDYKHHAGTATALLNTVRMTCSAIIGGFIAGLITIHSSIMAVSLLFCSLICLAFSFLIWSD